MAISKIYGGRVPIMLWAQLSEVEESAQKQLLNVALLPWVTHHVAVMPDVHFGTGATVGSVIAMRGAVAPSAVGVDIGCGMDAVRTNLTKSRLPQRIPEDLKSLYDAVREAIPVGFNSHGSPVYDDAPDPINREARDLMARFYDLTPEVHQFRERAACQLGTLGGGNHFIELCLDTEDRVWCMLHSGSRHIGLQIAATHIKRAKRLSHNARLPDADLSVFLNGTPEMNTYRHDLAWALEYARLNRAIMLARYQDVLKRHFKWKVQFENPISCHHNYAAEEEHFGETLFITRKGAISARAGEMGIIPGSMGAHSYIVRGLGNPDSFMSAAHGAGRKMSRRQAKKTFTTAQLEAQTRDVMCRKDAGVLDEAPGAYKNIKRVMENQRDLVEPIHELRQVICVKG
ncbi:MAG: RtcB family protein [Candidatus Uhrbacteria bacterium]